MFTPTAPMEGEAKVPVINFNGSMIADATALQTMFEELPSTRYETHSIDCQVIQTNMLVEGRTEAEAVKGKNMSILVVVTGSVGIGARTGSETKGFSDTFVLVPNSEVRASGRRDRKLKEWLVQSYNSRIIS